MTVLAIGGASVAQTARAPNSNDAKLVSEFRARAEKYVAWREHAAGKAPSASESPERLDAERKELANKIRTTRAGARQGEVFGPKIAEYFRRRISAALNGPHGGGIRASLRRSEPVKLELQINESYPQNVPLQSTPPTLLINLPELPKGLEYRILDRELVLRDTDANVIVDYIPDALPGDTE